MYMKTALLFLATSALAFPFAQNSAHKRSSVLTTRPYAEFQISNGVGGDALAEVHRKFPIDESDLANVDKADQDIIHAARKTAENAETESGGFNEAIAAAKNDEEAAALQVGKIKNKVLKLKLEVLDLAISVAKGKNKEEKLAVEQKKLDANLALDKENAGKPSLSVAFTE